MGCTEPREPGWDPTWAAVGRVGELQLGASRDAAEKGRERRVWRTSGTPKLLPPATGRSARCAESVPSAGRGPSQLAGRSD